VVPGAASADVDVREPATLWVITHASFERLREATPGAAVGLLSAVSRDVAARLRVCSAGLIRRTASGQLELAYPDAEEHHFLDFLKRLLGFREAESFDLHAFLRGLPAFDGLTDKEFEALETALEVKDLPADHAFIEQGDRPDVVYFILDGSVSIRARRPGATGYGVDKEVGPGAIVGLVSLVDGGLRSATCTTLTPTKVAVLPYEAAHLLMNDHARIGCAFQATVAAQLARDARELNESLVHAIRRFKQAPAEPA
jgi:CRP-like cAMP-binding protein